LTDLFTCSYRAYQQEMGQAVAISLGLPKFLPEAEDWPRFWLATPRWSYFKSGPEFPGHYRAQLDRYGPAKVTRVLEQIAREHHAGRLVLMCHEADPERCHRWQFAAWLLERAGVLVTEVP
jgi:Protein of unknown function, DUF488